MHWSSKGGKVQKLPPRWGLRSSQLVHLPTPFVLFRSNLWWFCNVHEKKSKLISDLSKFISQVSHDFMFDSKCPCLAAYVPWQTLNLELVSRILPGCSWDLQSWRCWEVDVHKAPMSWWPNLQKLTQPVKVMRFWIELSAEYVGFPQQNWTHAGIDALANYSKSVVFAGYKYVLVLACECIGRYLQLPFKYLRRPTTPVTVANPHGGRGVTCKQQELQHLIDLTPIFTPDSFGQMIQQHKLPHREGVWQRSRLNSRGAVPDSANYWSTMHYQGTCSPQLAEW